MNSPEWNPSLPISDAASPVREEPPDEASPARPPADPGRTPGPAGSASDWLTPGRFGLLLALLVLAAFPEVTLGWKTFVHRDFGLFGYPLAAYHRDCFWRGELPLWNPYNNAGLPFLGQWNTLVLYPGSLVYLLLPLPWSLNFFCLLHLFWAGFGMYLLARSWTKHRLAAALAGTAFAFNGLTLNALMWPNNIAALGWMPWVVWLVEQGWRKGGRSLLLAAAAGALQLLTGAPEVVLFTWLLLGALWAGHWWRQTGPRAVLVRRGLGLGLLAGGLSAAQLFPFLDLLHHSHRDAQFATNAWSMPAWGWMNFLVPLFRVNRSGSGLMYQPLQYWTSSYYLSIGVVALAVWALTQWRQPRVRLLAVALLGSLVLALGDDGLVYRWVRLGFPIANIMRFPIKFVVLAVFLFPILAAWAFRSATEQASRNVARSDQAFRWLWFSMALGIGGSVGYAFLWPMHPSDSTVSAQSGMLRLLFLSVLLLGARLACRDFSGTRWWLAPSLVVLIWLDVLTHAPWQNPTSQNAVLAPAPLQPMETTPALGQSRAMLTLGALEEFYAKNMPDPADTLLLRRQGLHNDVNLLDGIPKVDGFFSLYLPEERAVHFRLYASEREVRRGLADFLGVTQMTHPTNSLAWASRPEAMPLITAGQQVVFADPQQTLAGITTPQFQPRKIAFLPAEAEREMPAIQEANARVLDSTWSAHRVRANVETPSPSVVMISQTHYHPWLAFVDGIPAKLWRANFAFQAVAIPAGRHRVELIYRDRWFQAGVVVTGLCLGVWLTLWWRQRGR